MTVPRPAVWREAWGDARFRAEALFTLVFLGTAFRATSVFFAWVEERPGVTLADPVLSAWPARDATWLIFVVIYLSLAVALATLAGRPRGLAIALQAYAVLLFFRIAVLYVTPLDPPAGMILLRDPLTEMFRSERALTRDLFFSGHTSTLCLAWFAMPEGRCRPFVLSSTAVVALALLAQHVHYTVDVLAAPAFALASHRTVLAVHAWWTRRAQGRRA